MVQETAYPHSRAPGAPYPGWSHHSLARWVSRYRDTEAIMPVNGQVERMNRTIKEATVKRYHYDSRGQLERHLNGFVDAYNFGRRLKTLKGLTPYEFICKAWTSDPERFILNPLQQMPGLNTFSGGCGPARPGLTSPSATALARPVTTASSEGGSSGSGIGSSRQS